MFVLIVAVVIGFMDILMTRQERRRQHDKYGRTKSISARIL